MRDLFIDKRYGLLPDRSNDYNLEKKLLQFAIMAGRGAGARGNKAGRPGSGKAAGRGRSRSDPPPPRRKKGAPRAGEVPLYSSAFWEELSGLSASMLLC